MHYHLYELTNSSCIYTHLDLICVCLLKFWVSVYLIGGLWICFGCGCRILEGGVSHSDRVRGDGIRWLLREADFHSDQQHHRGLCLEVLFSPPPFLAN